MKIGIDLDGVLYPWHDEVWKYILMTTPEIPNDPEWFWSSIHNRKQFFGYDPLDFIQDIDFFYTSGSPLPDSSERMLSFILREHEVFYVTARSKTSKDATKFWLKKHNYLHDEKRQLYFSKDKASVSETLGLDFFIDDKPSTLENLIKTKTQPLGIKQYWNKILWQSEIPMFPTLGSAIKHTLK